MYKTVIVTKRVFPGCLKVRLVVKPRILRMLNRKIRSLERKVRNLRKLRSVQSVKQRQEITKEIVKNRFMKNPNGYLAKLLKREKIYRERYAKSRSNADRLKISVIQRKIREVKALKNDTDLKKRMKYFFTRSCTKKRSTKRVPRKRVVKNLKKKILRLRYQKKRAPKAQRQRINRKLHRALVIKNGKKHVKKVGGQLRRYQRIPKGKRTPKVQRLIRYYGRL